MIRLNEEDSRLLVEMEGEISKEELMKNWEHFMEFTPISSGSPNEEAAIQFLREKLEEYGLEPQVLRFDAYISEPKWAKIEVLSPQKLEVRCTPYRQVGTTGPDGVEGDVVYIDPDSIGRAECRDKIVLADQATSGDWMGLRNGLLLKLQEMGVKGLIVIEQDSFMPTVVHQRADFSVSGNPTSDNVHLIQRIPAIIHISNKDGGLMKTLAKKGEIRVRVTSIVETGWKRLPLLVAEIRGAKDPEKFLLVNGHIDTPPFSPGVTDNASGDIAILELARILNIPQEGGILITKVAKNSPAALLGLQPGHLKVRLPGDEEIILGGDVVLEVQGIPAKDIESYGRIRQALRQIAPTDKLRVKVLRGGQIVSLEKELRTITQR